MVQFTHSHLNHHSSIRHLTGESNKCTFPGAQVGVKGQGSNHAFHVRLPGVCAGSVFLAIIFLDVLLGGILARGFFPIVFSATLYF